MKSKIQQKKNFESKFKTLFSSQYETKRNLTVSTIGVFFAKRASKAVLIPIAERLGNAIDASNRARSVRPQSGDDAVESRPSWSKITVSGADEDDGGGELAGSSGSCGEDGELQLDYYTGLAVDWRLCRSSCWTALRHQWSTALRQCLDHRFPPLRPLLRCCSCEYWLPGGG